MGFLGKFAAEGDSACHRRLENHMNLSCGDARDTTYGSSDLVSLGLEDRLLGQVAHGYGDEGSMGSTGIARLVFGVVGGRGMPDSHPGPCRGRFEDLSQFIGDRSGEGRGLRFGFTDEFNFDERHENIGSGGGVAPRERLPKVGGFFANERAGFFGL